MKQFFKYVFATVTGIIIFHLIVLLIFVISIMSMGSKGALKVQDNSVLEINLTGNISERTEENPLASFIGNPNAGNISLENVLKAIKRAKEEEKIKGIYIQGGIMTGASPAMLEEIHDALVDFKTSKKFIMAYADMTPEEARTFKPAVLFVDEHNKIIRKASYEHHGLLSEQ